MLQGLAAQQNVLLEFLSEDKVEVASAALAEDFIKAVSPVDTHHTHHRQEYADTDAGATLERKGIEVLDRSPCVAGLGKGQCVNCGGRLKHKREVKFDTEASVCVTFAAVRSELTVVISSQGDGLGSVGVAAGHTVTTYIEGLEGGLEPFVVATQKADIGTGHQDGSPRSVGVGQRGVGARFEA